MMSFSEDAIKEFRRVVATCYGPLGRVALLQPVAGGHVTITCQSSRIFQLLKSSNLLIQLLYASLINHSLEYRDGTKTAAILTSNIILNMLHLDHPKRQIANVIDHLLERGIEYIEKSCHIPLDWSSIHQLMDVTRSLISPHSLLNYNQQELDHLSSLILQAFLHVILTDSNNDDSSSIDRIHLYLISEVKSPLPSLYKGLLIEDGHCTGIDHVVQLPLTFFNKKGHIITAVFNISLAGDQPDGFIDKISIEASSLCDSSALQGEVIYQELMDVGRSLIDRNVEVVLCQKCVHPSLRNVLEHQGVVIVERLGSNYIDAVISITGGHVISSLSSVDTAHLGSLTMVTMVTIGDNRYLQVDGCGVPHASLMLPYLLEIIGEELKSVVFSCMKVLEGLLYQPRLVNGGGCVLTQLAHHVHHQLNQADDDTLKKLMCSRRTFTDVSHCIRTSLFQTCSSLVYNSRDDIALTDSQTHHCWIISDASPLIRTCSCGSINVTSLSEPQWVPLHGVNEMDPLIPDELTTHTTSANTPPVPHIWDSLPQTVASLNISRQLATTFITTYKIHH